MTDDERAALIERLERADPLSKGDKGKAADAILELVAERDGARRWAYEQRLKKHRSGCACHISDDEELVSVCAFHQDLVDRARADERARVVKEATTDETVRRAARVFWNTDGDAQGSDMLAAIRAALGVGA